MLLQCQFCTTWTDAHGYYIHLVHVHNVEFKVIDNDGTKGVLKLGV